ncbi:helix-turn-helix domain-containing protein [Zhihengliuella flava]|uniref:Transcriptional regulator with XRE-family HTH domain n=1 Tax=Zhihengliuella flava TaxID=1285193 RepID=A0A931GE97_9MICC|nr:helix-turn-helix transcriptional regulator [Zhihengliuella flava]MBG6083282.1 transcriptional regulator with XRE-family HTH domain [Zhihengliuella flava]
MNTRERSEAFTRYVGLELKGRITAHGFTAKTVAESMGRSVAAFNRWLNGKVEIPLSVVCEACELIDIDPREIVERAYDRMAMTLGERDGRTYEEEDVSIALAEARALEKQDANDPTPDYSKFDSKQAEDYGLAAYRGDANIGPDELPHEP